MLQKEIEAKLGAYQDIYLEQDLLSVRALKQIVVDETRILVDIALGYPHQTIKENFISELKELIHPLTQGKSIELNLTTDICAHVGKLGLPGIPNIKNIIVVASGKGGVGKSTIAVNLALALSKEGAKVGLLDADFYGPSQPTMLGVERERPVLKDKKLLPIERYGLQVMSIGFLVDQQSAMMWRGPMIGKALQQLIYDTAWNSLDYLVVDLPPGTGDVQLTLCQKIPVSGAVIVTTPQDLALLDVRRACEMFQKLNVPILGVVENMHVYRCQHCGHEDHLFGKDGASQLAEYYKVPILGKLPLNMAIREMTDSGKPTVVSDVDSEATRIFHTIALKTAAKLSLQAKDYSAKFPKIVIQNN